MDEDAINGDAFRDAKRGKKCRQRKPVVQGHKPIGRGRARQGTFVVAVSILVVFLLSGGTATRLYAQPYPSKPIRLILPMAPGGAVDVLGRIVGSKLADQLSQPVVPENRPGAAGNLGIQFASTARPDGYTIVFVTPGLAISPSLYKKLNYDAMLDLLPISLVAEGHQVLFVHPSLPVKNLKEFVEYARANPGKINFGSAGIGGSSHLAGELLKSLAKIDLVHVPYKGTAPAMMALMGGEIQMVVSGIAGMIPQIEAGKIRPLAVLSNKRLPSLPNLPTAKEAGIDNYVATTWYGILAPTGTSREIIGRLNAAWVKIAAMADTREKMHKVLDAEPLSSTPEQFGDFIKSETIRWARVIKEAHIPTLD